MLDSGPDSYVQRIRELLRLGGDPTIDLVDLRGASLPTTTRAGRRMISATLGLEHLEPTRQFCLEGRPLALTDQEYRLLHLFADHPNQVLTVRQLLAGAWSDALESDRNALQTCVSRLRAKLGSAGAALLQTRHRVGYCFVAEPGGAPAEPRPTDRPTPISAYRSARPTPAADRRASGLEQEASKVPARNQQGSAVDGMPTR